MSKQESVSTTPLVQVPRENIMNWLVFQYASIAALPRRLWSVQAIWL